jgi:hypothetical protein
MPAIVTPATAGIGTRITIPGSRQQSLLPKARLCVEPGFAPKYRGFCHSGAFVARIAIANQYNKANQ